jgi:hypothetical protein
LNAKSPKNSLLKSKPSDFDQPFSELSETTRYGGFEKYVIQFFVEVGRMKRSPRRRYGVPTW